MGDYTYNEASGSSYPSADLQLGYPKGSAGEGFPQHMTTVERDALSGPAAGLTIYDTTTNKLNFYNGTAWEIVTSST